MSIVSIMEMFCGNCNSIYFYQRIMVEEKMYQRQSLLPGVSDLLLLLLFYLKYNSMPIIHNKIQSIEIYRRFGKLFDDENNI